jgi:hypothetical protein
MKQVTLHKQGWIWAALGLAGATWVLGQGLQSDNATGEEELAVPAVRLRDPGDKASEQWALYSLRFPKAARDLKEPLKTQQERDAEALARLGMEDPDAYGRIVDPAGLGIARAQGRPRAPVGPDQEWAKTALLDPRAAADGVERIRNAADQQRLARIEAGITRPRESRGNTGRSQSRAWRERTAQAREALEQAAPALQEFQRERQTMLGI